MSRILKLTSLTLCLAASLFAQAKSQLEFFDSTGANSTAKIGWSGTATDGKFSIETPNDGGNSVTVKNGVLTAKEINGGKIISANGSEILNINSANVTGLSVLLQAKANVTRTDSLQTAISGKVDSTFVAKKIVSKVDSAWVTNKFAPKGSIGSSGLADSAVTSIKIADSSIISQKIKSNSIDSTKVKDGMLSWADINKSSVNGISIQNVTGLTDSLKKRPDTSWVRSIVTTSTGSIPVNYSESGTFTAAAPGIFPIQVNARRGLFLLYVRGNEIANGISHRTATLIIPENDGARRPLVVNETGWDYVGLNLVIRIEPFRGSNTSDYRSSRDEGGKFQINVSAVATPTDIHWTAVRIAE